MDMQWRPIALGAYPIDGLQDLRLLHDAPLERIFAWKVQQHHADQYRQQALPGQEQHGNAACYQCECQQVLAKQQCKADGLVLFFLAGWVSHPVIEVIGGNACHDDRRENQCTHKDDHGENPQPP